MEPSLVELTMAAVRPLLHIVTNAAAPGFAGWAGPSPAQAHSGRRVRLDHSPEGRGGRGPRRG